MPNIKGSIENDKYFLIPTDNPKIFKGCLSGVSGSGASWRDSVSDPHIQKMYLDASKTSSGNGKAYQDNAEVKTKNFTYKIWIRKF